jgi:hypothetical protein
MATSKERKTQILQNVKNSFGPILNLVRTELTYSEVKKISLSDFDIMNDDLQMVMLNLEISYEFDGEIGDFVSELITFNKDIHRILDKITFNSEGKLTPKSKGGHIRLSGILPEEINYNVMNDVVNLKIDAMYSPLN